MIQLPRLLDKQFQTVARLHPARLTATDKLEPTSTATMGLPHGEPSVGLRDFVELFDSDGSKGIYRVEGINASNGERQTISLSHGIVTLEDYIMPPDANLQGSIKAMLAAVLAQQVEQLWTLGDVEVPEEEIYTVNAGNAIALQAIINIASLVPEFAFSYDQSVTPWVLHFRRREQVPSCECRLSRNMSNISVSFSPQEMCTRVTSDLLPNGYMDADNVTEWGAIVRELPTESDTTPDEALELAVKYLDQHKHPTTTIEIEAIDLAKQTGESLDSLVLGRLCRVALPDWGVTYNHQIVSVYWADLIGKPQQKKLSLATRKKRAGTALAQAAQAKRQSSRNFKHITETDNSVMIQAQLIELLGEEIALRATKNEVEEATLRISTVEIELDAAQAAIELKADRTEYNDLEKRVTTAEIDIDGAAAAITLKADATSVDALGTRVSSAEISIDGLNSEILLKADKIELEGLVKATELEAVQAEITNLTAGVTTAATLKAGVLNADNVLIVGGEILGKRSITMGDVVTVGKALSTDSMDLQHSHAVSVNSSGKLQLGGVTTEGNGGNFNIADTQFYKDGVSAAINSVTVYSPFVDRVEHPGASSKLMRVYMQAKASNGASSSIVSELISAAPVYNVGWNACIDACEATTALYRITQDLSTTTLFYQDGTAAGTGFVRVARVYNTYFIPEKK